MVVKVPFYRHGRDESDADRAAEVPRPPFLISGGVAAWVGRPAATTAFPVPTPR
jgi:hypothetical protein